MGEGSRRAELTVHGPSLAPETVSFKFSKVKPVQHSNGSLNQNLARSENININYKRENKALFIVSLTYH